MQSRAEPIYRRPKQSGRRLPFWSVTGYTSTVRAGDGTLGLLRAPETITTVLLLDLKSSANSNRFMSTVRPKEFDMDDKWDKVVDTFLRRAVYGSLAGGAAGVLLFRE